MNAITNTAAELTDEQIDTLVRGVCHSEPVMASGEYCLTVDEVRSLLQHTAAPQQQDRVLDKTVIKRLAAQTGFSLKQETPEGPDLKPYVYDFAFAIARYVAPVAPAAPSVPEGYALVPLICPDNAAAEGRDVLSDPAGNSLFSLAENAYEAMVKVAAAPAAQAPVQPVVDFSRPLETADGEPVKHVCADVIEYKSARVCVDQATGVVYSSPYRGLQIRNAASAAQARVTEGGLTDREIMLEWDRHYLPGNAKGTPFLQIVVEFARHLMAGPTATSAAQAPDAKDAERYRWLRDAENGGELSVGKHISVCDEYPRYEQVDWLYGQELDAAIDTIRALQTAAPQDKESGKEKHE